MRLNTERPPTWLSLSWADWLNVWIIGLVLVVTFGAVQHTLLATCEYGGGDAVTIRRADWSWAPPGHSCPVLVPTRGSTEAWWRKTAPTSPAWSIVAFGFAAGGVALGATYRRTHRTRALAPGARAPATAGS